MMRILFVVSFLLVQSSKFLIVNSFSDREIDPIIVSKDRCNIYDNCTKCYNSGERCHWCGFDQQCHSIGSLKGCVMGEDCSHKDRNDTSCFSAKSCTECAKSSLCHWCGFDNKCHAKGSAWGCVAGVDCYSNDRCERKTPEKRNEDLYHMINAPISIIAIGFMISLILMFCVHIGFCFIKCAKGAYDDLICLLPKQEENVTRDCSLLLSPEQENHEEDLKKNNKTRKELESTKNHADMLFKGCSMIHMLAILLIIFLFLSFVFYYPAKPEYNLCNQSFDWKSIVDGMTSLKMEASFQFLISIYNPNKVSMQLNKATGTFKHDGTYVGSFSLSPPEGYSYTSLEANSVSDFLITTTFTPDKWQALALSTEYYKGTLTFDVSSEMTVAVPALGGYTFDVNFQDYFIHVDVTSDRHLCKCPTWDDSTLSLY